MDLMLYAISKSEGQPAQLHNLIIPFIIGCLYCKFSTLADVCISTGQFMSYLVENSRGPIFS